MCVCCATNYLEYFIEWHVVTNKHNRHTNAQNTHTHTHTHTHCLLMKQHFMRGRDPDRENDKRQAKNSL